MSIAYYSKNVETFINNTKDANMQQLYDVVLPYLQPTAKVLDIGCGSGRDSRFFLSKGFDVTAFDGSEEMVEYCSAFLGERVSLATFENYSTTNHFDLIWACASLLHVERNSMAKMMNKFGSYLSDDGIFLMSFKERDYDYEKDGRVFTCYTEVQLKRLIENETDLNIIQFVHTTDVRKGREDEKWISVLINRHLLYNAFYTR